MIKVENISKRYGERVVVDGVSFTVEKGQIYGFLGPNGAGKSTTMNIMTGYIAASSGTVRINGFDILAEPEKAKQCIGYLPEIPPLYTDMTVHEYLMFVAELKKVPKKERAVHVGEIMGKTQLEDVAGRLIRNLSKGYKQRTGLAQALIGYPKVLILDEPMAGLDPKQILEMRDLITELSEEHTILLSSHILSEVSAVCDHIMILSGGKLAASGSPEELQEMMQGKTRLEVVVFGEKEQAEEILQGIKQITEWEIGLAEEAGSIKIQLDVANNEDIRKELSVALAGAGMPILSMNRLERSLEDIFLELTKDVAQGEDEAEQEAADIEENDVEPDQETADTKESGLESEETDTGPELQNIGGDPAEDREEGADDESNL